MLSRCLSRTANLCLRTLNSSSNKSLHSSLLPCSPSSPNLNFNFIHQSSRFFSSNRNNNHNTKDPSISNSWRISPDNDDEQGNSIFGDDNGGDFTGFTNDNGSFSEKSVNRSDVNVVDSWGKDDLKSDNIFGDVDKEFEIKKSEGDGWETAEGYKPWSFDEDEKSEVFDIGDDIKGISVATDEKEIEDAQKLEEEEKQLTAVLKGPNRAFGDLIAASGITDAMLDSLIALKDLENVEGLPPLSVIEDLRLAKTEMRSANSELERKKQEEIAKSRVRRVDDNGIAYGTGRRKCSVARVFIQPGEGTFIINDKQFDAYFPLLDHRATLLSPFSETKTLGLWDVKCTVKGGGVTDEYLGKITTKLAEDGELVWVKVNHPRRQVGAIRLGVSRALQNWEPGLRPNLRAAGFLTRDPRMVERKKPGKAKARKSFQWVKR